MQVVEASSHQERCRCSLVSPGCRLHAVHTPCIILYIQVVASSLHLYTTPAPAHLRAHAHAPAHALHLYILFQSQWLYTAPYRGSSCALHLRVHIHVHMHIHLHMPMHLHLYILLSREQKVQDLSYSCQDVYGSSFTQNPAASF